MDTTENGEIFSLGLERRRVMGIEDELRELNSMHTPKEVSDIGERAAGEIERLREALTKVCNSLEDNLPVAMTKADYWEVQADMWHQNYKEAANEIERLREMVTQWQNDWHKDHLDIFRHRWDAIVLQKALWIAAERLVECKMGEASTKNFVIELYNDILREAKEGRDVGGRRD